MTDPFSMERLLQETMVPLASARPRSIRIPGLQVVDEAYRPPVPQVIVKVRAGTDSERHFFSVEPGGTAPAPIAKLLGGGHITRVEPVFSRPAERARRHARAAAVAERGLSGILALQPADREAVDDLVADLRAQAGVEYAYRPPVRVLYETMLGGTAPASVSTDPLFSRQWAHAAVRIGAARSRPGFDTASGITVAVVDSGVDPEHPDLKAAISSSVSYVQGEDDRDLTGHGTHVAGIISATANNGMGVRGLCEAKVMSVKALALGGYDAKAYYRALAHAIDQCADVINLSLGGAGPDHAEADLIAEAIEAGIVVVAAMGNEYMQGNPESFPAAYDGVVAVGATDELDRRAYFSNTGAHISLVAPGMRILSTTPRYPTLLAREQMYDAWPGTSMATPHVSAAVALLLANLGRMSPAEVRDRLRATADRLPGQDGPNEEVGWGRLNVEAALSV